MKHKIRHFRLRRELGLFELTMYGIGVILGAGIYALIGAGAGITGYNLWAAFVIAAIVASFSGLSFAELSSMYPKEASAYVYTQKAFNRRMLSFIVGWLLIASGIIGSATVALGFSGYFANLFFISGATNLIIIAALLIVMLSLVNYIGIEISAKFNVVSTIIEASGLVLVAIIGILFMSGFLDTATGFSIGNYFTMNPGGITAIISAAALIFFAYLGFEDIVIVSEETKNARKNVPKALILAMVISTVLYILVSFSSLAVMTPEELSSSKAPLTDVVEKAVPRASFLMSVIALFATANTVLIILIVMSRMLCGVAREHSMPECLGRIGNKGTPYISVFLIMALTVGSLFIGGIDTIAKLTTLSVFIVFVIVNLSLIVLRYKEPGMQRSFRVPVNIGRFPVIPFLGLVSCFGMIFYLCLDLGTDMLFFQIFVILTGVVLYKIFNRK
jgi:APA family basic amino acid/polyamine antiporter